MLIYIFTNGRNHSYLTNVVWIFAVVVWSVEASLDFKLKSISYLQRLDSHIHTKLSLVKFANKFEKVGLNRFCFIRKVADWGTIEVNVVWGTMRHDSHVWKNLSLNASQIGTIKVWNCLFVVIEFVEVWWCFVNLSKVQMVSIFDIKSTHFSVRWSNEYKAIASYGSGKVRWCFLKVQIFSKVCHKSLSIYTLPMLVQANVGDVLLV